MTKKILYITYHFPPSKKIGAIRAKGFAKYMPAFNWEVIILSPVLPGNPDKQFHVVETHPPYQKILPYLLNSHLLRRLRNISICMPPIYQRFYSFFRGMIDIPDSRIGWLPFAVCAGKKIIEKEKPVAIVSNFGPACCHIVASYLKKSYPKVFWLADFRDPWTQFRSNSLRTIFEKKLENKTLKYANALSIVSDSLAVALGKSHLDKPVYVIPNGFDPEEMLVENNPISDKFVITHTGSLHKIFRTPSLIFNALQNLIKLKKVEKNHIRVMFYGPKQSWVLKQARQYQLENIVSYNGIKDREEIVKIQRNSQILLLIWRSGKGEEGTLTGKIFEYLSAGRPIISTGKSADEVEQLLQKTNAGTHCKTVSEIQNLLYQKYQQWLKNRTVRYEGIIQEIMKYSHLEMARKFSQVIENG